MELSIRVQFPIAAPMERELKIKTPDKKIIFGTLVTSKKRQQKLIIFIHGFTGHQNEHLFFNGAKFFKDKGIDTFRFDLYTGRKGARHFHDTNIKIHSNDLNTVIKYFLPKYKKIYLVGHSFGGTTLLFTDVSNIKALVFWDPGYIGKKKLEFRYDKKFKAYIEDYGIEIIVGDKFVAEMKDFPDCGELISKIKKPVKFITAGKRSSNKTKYNFYLKANEPKDFTNFREADHNFNSFEAEGRLFEETLKWINKY